MKKVLQNLGIRDDSFELLTVAQLVANKVLEKPLDGNHGEIHPKGADFVSEGVPFIMATDVIDGRVRYDSCNFITAKQADSLRKGFAKNGDVLLTHKATIGRTAIVRYDKHPYIMLTPQVTYYRIRNRQRLDNRYLRHYFDSELFQKTLHLWADSGSTRAYLGITEQQKLPIIVPPIEKQRKIAAILSAYDELIENNSRRITLLERMAADIYREWFVRLRFPGHKQIKVVKGIPTAWSFERGSTFFGLVKGKSYSADEITENPEHMPFISLKSFNRQGGYREDGLKYYSGRFKENQVAHQNDVVVAITDMTQDRAVVGRAARIPDLGKRGAVISLDAVKLVPHNINKAFLYAYMRYSGFSDFIKEFANGANVLHLKPDLIPKQKIIIPPRSLQDDFAAKVNPMYAQLDIHGEANKRLALVRDRLLPRLISGQLDVEGLDVQFPLGMTEELRADVRPVAYA